MPEVRRGSRTNTVSSDADAPTAPSPAGGLLSDVTPSNGSPPSLAEKQPSSPQLPPLQTASSTTSTPHDTPASPTSSPLSPAADGTSRPRKSITILGATRPTTAAGSSSAKPASRRTSISQDPNGIARKSLSYSQRPEQPVYYDSRAATESEYQRRAHTLQEYYDENPQLLPQLPFTWRHGQKRWRLGLLIFFMFVDACAVPVGLYYSMYYAGDVEGWIIFAVVTTIWGGPTYLEFAVRTLRLIKKERFYRPLGTNSRWSFDLVNWASVLTITVVTALFIIGSAPHNVWLRVLTMPAPAILYCLGGVLALITLYNAMGWKAPFRISSTGKGEPVLPGAYYFMEDVVAVNARAGRPYREALAARYKASPRFRQMLYKQSLFWSIPSLILAIPLTVIAVIDQVPATVAYGVCWVVPFLWAIVWGLISTWWCKKDLVRERLEWESDNGSISSEGKDHVEP